VPPDRPGSVDFCTCAQPHESVRSGNWSAPTLSVGSGLPWVSRLVAVSTTTKTIQGRKRPSFGLTGSNNGAAGVNNHGNSMGRRSIVAR